MRAILLAVLAFLVAAWVGAGSAAAAFVVPDAGIRVVATGNEYQREMDLAGAAGVPWVTISSGWGGLQPTASSPPGPDGPGGAAWRDLEAKVRYAHSIGLRTFVQFTGAPSWATDGRPANTKGNVPPTEANLPAYAALFTAVARGLGQYIDAYSPWNEVNQPDFWDVADPVLLAKMQRAVYPAIKAADPSAIVVSGSVYSKDGAFDYLRQAYAAGLAASFDVLGWMMFPAIAPDSPPRTPVSTYGFPQRNLSSVPDLRALLNQVDPGRRIWVVEYSYSTCPTSNPLCVSEAQQADYLTRAFTYMRRYTDVERLFWFSLRDKEVRDTIEANYGLMHFDFSPKPAYEAMRALRVEVPDAATGGGPEAQSGSPVPGLPAKAARPPSGPSFAAGGRRVTLGRPALVLRRGTFTLRLRVVLTGGRSTIAVQGFRGGRWRAIARVVLRRTSVVTVRFRDRGFLGIRVRGTRPGGRGWVVSRVIRVPTVRAAARPAAARRASARAVGPRSRKSSPLASTSSYQTTARRRV